MTADEKKERRKLRKELQAQVLKHHFGEWKFRARNGQMKAAARKVADQLLAGKNVLEVMRIRG